MTSNIINKSSKKKSRKKELMEDEKIDLILKDITLRKPLSAYHHFIKSQVEIIKAKNNEKKIQFSEINTTISEKWKKLEESKKKKYKTLFEEDRKRYLGEIEIVRHYLFKDYNDTIFKAPTAYGIFLNEKFREGFKEGLEPKEVEKNALLQWKEMSISKKEIYIEKKKKNDILFLKAQKIIKINTISLFTKIQFERAKKIHKELPSLEEVTLSWKELSSKKKNNYKKYTQKINDKKEKLQDLYDIIHGVKPKRPTGAFYFFLKEKAKNNEMKDLKVMIEIWKELKEEEKEKYLLRNHRCILAYKYKKMIYTKKIKRFIPKKPSIMQLFLKEKKGQKPPNGENWLIYWSSVFKNFSENQKKKYEEKFQKYQKDYEKKMEQFENKVFDLPKKPNSGFSLYWYDRYPVLKEKNPNETYVNIVKQITKEWAQGELFDKNDYLLKAENDKNRFKKQLNEFEKFGYYTKCDIKNEENDNEDNDENEKRKRRTKKRNMEHNFQGTKKNKNSISNEQNRNESMVRNKIIKKNGKSQKYKK